MKKFKVSFEMMSAYPVTLCLFVYGSKVTKSLKSPDCIQVDNSFITLPSYITNIEEVEYTDGDEMFDLKDLWKM